MALSIALSVVIFAIIGAGANNFVGRSGGLLHNAFIGFAGSVLANVTMRVFRWSPYGFFKLLLLYFVGACIVAFVLECIRSRYGNTEDPDDGEE